MPSILIMSNLFSSSIILDHLLSSSILIFYFILSSFHHPSSTFINIHHLSSSIAIYYHRPCDEFFFPVCLVLWSTGVPKHSKAHAPLVYNGEPNADRAYMNLLLPMTAYSRGEKWNSRCPRPHISFILPPPPPPPFNFSKKPCKSKN